jgi:hypothetical protein
LNLAITRDWLQQKAGGRWAARAVAVLVFLVLPYALKRFGVIASLSDGIYLATGIAVVLYTVETFYLRSEMARQNELARDQAETAIRPLLVLRIELFADPGNPNNVYAHLVLRNIGHGPALFAELEPFELEVWSKGTWKIKVAMTDLVEPGVRAELHPAPSGGQGGAPDETIIIESLRPASGHVARDYTITITYSDIRNVRFTSVMQIGPGGIRLLGHS